MKIELDTRPVVVALVVRESALGPAACLRAIHPINRTPPTTPHTGDGGVGATAWTYLEHIMQSKLAIIARTHT